jgi:hypothetical protein
MAIGRESQIAGRGLNCLLTPRRDSCYIEHVQIMF